MNKVILMGNLTKDPEIKYTQGAEPTAIASFSIAVQRRFKRDGDTDVDFINCVCFGKQGETIGKFFTKGRKIAVVGRIQNNSWQDKEGNNRISTNIVVEEFYFCDSKQAESPAEQVQNKLPMAEIVEDDDALPW